MQVAVKFAKLGELLFGEFDERAQPQDYGKYVAGLGDLGRRLLYGQYHGKGSGGY